MIDLTDALTNPDLGAVQIDVIRRAETVGSDGLSHLVPTAYFRVFAVVTPAGPNDLRRLPEGQYGQQVINVSTTFRLYDVSRGFQPDVVRWRGGDYVVSALNDATNFGAGFVAAVCTSVDLQDEPPGLDDLPVLPSGASSFMEFLDTSAGPTAYHLPVAPSVFRAVTLKDRTGHARANPVTVTTVDGSMIDGVSSFVLNQNFESITFAWNGSGWSVL